MRIFSSVSFWILVFCLLFACFIGSFTHWIAGLIVFIVAVSKTALIGLILDTISGSLEYHHNRQDARAKKSIESLIFLKNKVVPK